MLNRLRTWRGPPGAALPMILLLLVWPLVKPRPAHAAMTCNESIPNMLFGSVNVISGTRWTTTTMASLSCTGAAANTTYRFCVNQRAGPDASGNQRRMKSGSNYLPFDLFSDPAYTVPFGNWPSAFLNGGTQVDLSSDSSGAISGAIPIYGDVPTSAYASPPASYSESMPGIASGGIQYGSTPSAGTCPIGPSTALATYTISATVTTNCSLSVSSMAFGATPAPIVSNVTTTATIGATCTSTTPYSVGLDAGQNASGSQRRMKSTSGDYLSYGLYLDPGYTQPWSSAASSTGCTNGVNTCVLNTGTGSTQNITVYGQVPPQNLPTVGAYSDSVVVTLTY